MRFDQTLDVCIRADLESNNAPMLLGEVGIGKSSWVEAYARNTGTKCFMLACNQLAEKADLTGARLVKGDDGKYRQRFYPTEVIVEAIEYAKANPNERPLLFLDEINRASSDVTTEALSLTTMRAIGNSKLPDNLRIITAGNKSNGKNDVISLDEASITRFVLYEVEPDLETYMNVNPNLNENVRAVLMQHPECLFQKPVEDRGEAAEEGEEPFYGDEEPMVQLTCPRTLTSLSNWLNNVCWGENGPENLRQLLAEQVEVDGVRMSVLQDRIEGHIGATPAATYILAEISSNMTNIDRMQPTVRVVRPPAYDEMRMCTTRIELDQRIAAMTERERSQCMTYCLYDREDNTAYVTALAPTMLLLNPEDSRTVMSLVMNDMVNRTNMRALRDTGTPLAQNMSTLMQSLD